MDKFGRFLKKIPQSRPHFGASKLRKQRRIVQASVIPKWIAGGVFGAAAVFFGGAYIFDARAGIHEYIFCPALRLLTDGETGHRAAIEFMKYGLAPKVHQEGHSEKLNVEVFGEKLDSPIGMAAGYDKNAEVIDPLYDLGFGYVEIGSVTPEPQPGNPKPRFFRLTKDDAVINRYGFNSDGHYLVLARLKTRFAKLWKKYGFENTDSEEPINNSLRKNKLLGINLGKNKFGDEVSDYVKGIENFGPYADVLVVNVSSPNTPGLRELQSELKLTNLLSILVEERDVLGKNLLGKVPPLLVKIAPDLSEPELASIAASAKASEVDGIIVSNTTVQRPVHSLLTKDPSLIGEAGGLSGKPLKQISLKALRTLSKHTKDSRIVLVGCGGISSGKDALEFGKAGATFVQLYTSLAYKGPGLPFKIKQELVEELSKEGKNWMDIVGVAS